MKKIELSTGEMVLLVATRAMLGAGIGMLVSGCLSDDQRKAVGGTLVGIGLLTTIPLAYDVISARRAESDELLPS